jgi:hypothetical protein
MMSVGSRRELAGVVARRYVGAKRAEKGRMLDEFVANTGYNRKYATHLLNHPPRKSGRKRKRRRRQRRYDARVQRALVYVWKAANGICSKRLVPFLPELVPALERHGHLEMDRRTRAGLLSLSAATADRLLARERRRFPGHGLGTTKPGSLLKHQIPVRTFADWNEGAPGFVEADLVAHCGDSTHGEYLHTLVLTDVATGWTEVVALANRSQRAVAAAVDLARRRFPFPLLGLDTDNGSEFLNHNLARYCRDNQITFTRCRSYKKNDQCYVEQKNWSVVRKLIGYERYEGEQSCRCLLSIYEPLRLYINFFQPSMKLLAKERLGARVKKRYDKARTPYRRALTAARLPKYQRRRLESLRLQLDLRWRIQTRLQNLVTRAK